MTVSRQVPYRLRRANANTLQLPDAPVRGIIAVLETTAEFESDDDVSGRQRGLAYPERGVSAAAATPAPALAAEPVLHLPRPSPPLPPRCSYASPPLSSGFLPMW
ncbi:hypothetical protein DL767_002818 [Monosporascus sp. MG133]|nr:hypothetical protein DL767_002818 [Monosporascus sp. MG133]